MPGLLDALRGRQDLMLDRMQTNQPPDILRIINMLMGRQNPPMQPQIGMMPQPPMGIPSMQQLQIQSLLQRLATAQQSFQKGAIGAQGGLRDIEGMISASQNPGLHSVVHEAGGRWRGLQSEGLPEPHVVFDDPLTGSTHYLPQSRVSRNNIMDLLGKSRSEFGKGAE